MSEYTEIPFYVSVHLIANELEVLAAIVAVQATIVFMIISLPPVAPIAKPAVAFLIPYERDIAVETAAIYTLTHQSPRGTPWRAGGRHGGVEK